MTEYKELYLPLFYNWYELTEELTNEEFGELVRALLINGKEGTVPDNLSKGMRIIYKLMLDSAKRAHASQRGLSQIRREAANKRWGKDSEEIQNDANGCKAMQSDAIRNKNENKNENKNGNGNGEMYSHSRARRETKKESLGNFDTDYAFMKAIERTYGSLDDDDDD